MRDARPAFAVATLTALFYLPGVGGEFLVWDDWSNFVNNPHYRGLSPRHLGWMFTTFHMGHYHPLTWITLGLDHAIWGMNPVGYHLTSLLLHAASAGLLFVALRELLAPRTPAAAGAAAAGALFWSLHPLRVESVAWISERRDVLCGLFFLLSVLAYLRMCRERDRGGAWGRWLAASTGAYAASLLSKSLGLTLPLALLVLDVFPLRRFAKGSRRRVLLEKVPYLVLAAADVAVMLAAMTEIGQVRPAVAPLERAAQASFGACFYLWKTLLPWNLSPLYPVEQGIDPAQPRFVVSLVAAALLTAGLAALASKRPAAPAAWAAYLLLAAPVLGAVVRGPQLAADRYTYLSMMPFSLLLAAGLRRGLEGRSRRVVAGAAAGVLALLGTLAAVQTRVWRDTPTLWTHAIDSGWGGAVAYTSRAAERFRVNDVAGARADLEEAIRRNPKYGLAWLNRGKIFEMRKERERAMGDYDRAIQCEMRSPEALERRASLRESAGDAAGAAADYTEAIRRFPAAAGPWVARAKLRLRAGETKAAIADFDEGLRRDPRDAVSYYERGCARAFADDSGGAWGDFSTALGLDPRLRGAHLNRGTLLGRRGDFRGAVAEFSEEIRLDPASLDAWRQRAVARMKLGARAEAASDFEQVLRLAPAGWAGRRDVEGWLAELRKK